MTTSTTATNAPNAPANTPTLTTERFTMRPLRHADTAALYPTFSDPDQCRFLTRPEFTSEEELWGWLGDPDWNGRTWIAQDAQGDVAGRFVAVPAHEQGVEEIGYVVAHHWQRQGVARECTAALIAHLFDTPIAEGGARKITAEVDAENEASVRLLERLGFVREAHFRQHETTHIGLRDVYWYGLLKG